MLGDQLGIMSKGRLRAFGTSLDLKNQYGSGYSLNCVKRTSDVSTSAIVSVVHSSVPTAALRTDAGHDVTITLPIDATSAFPQLFRQLESRSEQLGLATFGLAQTSLEEVFLSLAGDTNDDDEAEDNPDGSVASRSRHPDHHAQQREPLPVFICEPSFVMQLLAILRQVAINASRAPVGLIHGIIAPIAFTFLGTLVVPYVQNTLAPQSVDMLAVEGQGNCSSHPLAGSTGTLSSLAPGKGAAVYPTCEDLVGSLGMDGSDAYVAFCLTEGGHTLLYNQTDAYSSRTALACWYDAVMRAGGGSAGLATSYKPFIEKVGVNQIAGGALMGFCSNVFMVRT